jgi:hypothetical protein
MNPTTTARQVKAARQRRRRRLIAYGRYEPPFVDPTKAREHIAALREYGISRDAVAALAGLHEGLVEQLTCPGHHQYRTSIRRETEERILAARFDLDALPGNMQLDVAGTQRRIRALSCMGWGQVYLAERLGITVAAVGSYLTPTRRYVTVAVARRIRDLYAELEHKRGPSQRVAARAVSRGWVPPMAWDDDTIDHPDTTPDVACLRRPSTRTNAAVLEDVRWILRHDPGLTQTQVGHRLGMDRDAVSAAIGRAADAAAAAVYASAPFGPVTRALHDAALAARADVLTVRDQMTDNAEAQGHNVTRRQKDEEAA